MKAEYQTLIDIDKIKESFTIDLEKSLSPLSESGKALVDKVKHMIKYKGAGIKDVVIMLQSFQRGTKNLASNKWDKMHHDMYEYTTKNGNEKLSHKGNLPKAHFRWNSGQRYTLSENEIIRISQIVGLSAQPKVYSEYDKQAIDFLNSTDTSLAIEFKEQGAMNWDDKNTNRDIYYCVLKNKLGRHAFDFGQSIDGTTKKEKPSYYDVLSCLTKYDPYDFENFCNDFGYDTDSRQAKKTYKAVSKEWKAIEKIFTSEQLELLQEIN